VTRWEAEQAFWGSFGIPAYDDQTTFEEDEEPSFPHLTYQSFGGCMGQTATLTASLWYKDTGWSAIKAKADEIHKYITENAPLTIKLDEGYLWIKSPELTPFAQPAMSGDEQIKRIVLTFEAESLTKY
jgi:hypothetical protein